MSHFQPQYGAQGPHLAPEPSLSMAALAGFGAALVAAFGWAAISYASGYQIGIVAIAVGYAVGFAVRFAGKGTTTEFGVVGAAFALFGCILGSFLTIVATLSNFGGGGFLATFWAYVLSPGAVVDAFRVSFSPIDLLFYGFAVYQGFRSSIGSSSGHADDHTNDAHDDFGGGDDGGD